jgi:hypothetical protein
MALPMTRWKPGPQCKSLMNRQPGSQPQLWQGWTWCPLVGLLAPFPGVISSLRNDCSWLAIVYFSSPAFLPFTVTPLPQHQRGCVEEINWVRTIQYGGPGSLSAGFPSCVPPGTTRDKVWAVWPLFLIFKFCFLWVVTTSGHESQLWHAVLPRAMVQIWATLHLFRVTPGAK